MTVKNVVYGFFILEDLAYVRSKKGEAGLKKLQAMLPEFNLSRILSLRKYPLESEIALLRAMAVVVFGQETTEAWRLFGKINFESAKDSSFGRTLVSLLGKEPKVLISHATKIFAFFAPFITFTYTYKSDNEVAINLENDPYPKEYFLGSLEGFTDFIGKPAHVSVEDLGNKTHLCTITWPIK